MTPPDLTGTLTALLQATTVKQAWGYLEAHLSAVGFDRLLYANTRFRTGNTFGNLSDAMILSTFPTAYLERFLGDGLYRQAPNVLWASQNPGASVSWRVAAEQAQNGTLPADQIAVLALNARHGIVAGYTISFAQVSTRASGGIGLCSTTLDQAEIDAMWHRSGATIELLCRVAHLKISDLPHVGTRALTPRQRAVLEMVGDGKTTLDIATIWNRTPATVEKHLRLAREALEVETTAQAVLKAATLNQFFLMPAAGLEDASEKLTQR